MRTHLLATAALAALVGLASLAVAQEKAAPAGPKAPFNPYTTSKKGDWAVFKTLVKGGGTPPEGVSSVHKAVVTKADGTNVTVDEMDKGDDAPKATAYPAKGDLDLATLIDAKDKKIEDVKVTDEKKTAGGKEFACKKISCKVSDNESTGTAVFWVSQEVKAGGLVFAELNIKLGTNEVHATMELAGFGSEGKTEFGKTWADLGGDKVEKAEPEKGEKGEKGEDKDDMGGK